MMQRTLLFITTERSATDIALMLTALTGLIIAAVLADWICRRVLLRIISAAAAKSRNKLDDAIVGSGILGRAAHLAPALVIYMATPVILHEWPAITSAVQTAVALVIWLIIVMTASLTIDIAARFAGKLPAGRNVPVRGLAQIIQLLLYLAFAVSAFATLLGKSPVVLLSGLGALTAVLLLVFKDVILGFVAGIQLSANRMLQVGDWLEMPKYGADGDVMDISLTTVKVRNWDQTYTTIPTYALVSDSFKNWRGMSESGGRRIARSVFIDMNSITFCTAEMLDTFRKIQILKPYIDERDAEITEYNRTHSIDEAQIVNGRHMTNIGTFRAYITAYLRQHPGIQQSMMFLIRQLAPTDRGLPIQIYVFTNDTAWANYEAIQADIFDHILAVIPHFGLRVFQSPGGVDFRRWQEQHTQDTGV